MRVIDKLVLYLSISLSTMVMAQLPFFLQRFRPVRHGLLGSASSSYSSLFSPFTASSSLSPTYGSPGLLGSSSFGSSSLGLPGANSLFLGSPAFSSSSFGASPLTSFSNGPPSSSLASSLLAASSFGVPSYGSSSFSSSPFASASLHSPTIGSPSLGAQKFGSSALGSQSLTDLGTISNFEGFGGFDHADLFDDYPGFSNAGFAKDLNFAGSQHFKFQSPTSSSFNNEYAFRRRSVDKH
ncbi:hypothetical protein X975_15552, partial [Stegodyphus mimosarum]